MPNITLSIPEEIYNIMKKHKEIRWSEIARQAIEKFTRKLELLDEIDLEEKKKFFDSILQNSELTEADVLEIGEKVKENILERLMAKR
ncbi:MAG: hypothetical protein ACTSRW_06180 [Candidatus Helarchaeota archaeon]